MIYVFDFGETAPEDNHIGIEDVINTEAKFSSKIAPNVKDPSNSFIIMSF